MRTADEVGKLTEQLKAEGVTAPEVITRIAPECVGWPYVFGSWGEECTPSNRRKRERDDAPTIKSSCQVLRDSDRKSACDGCKWYPGGQRVRMYDCRGFTRWLLQQAGLDIAGSGATSQWDTAANWTQRGEIAQMPDVVCVLFRRKAGRMEHTGMHLGSGRVIHCSRNVEEGALKGGNWTHYAIPRGLYDEREIPVSPVRRTLRKGAQGADVKTLQTFLIAWGCEPGTPDGIFGKQTDAALRAFQRAQGLTVDGVCGPATWNALTQPVETYTIRIEGATYQQYRRILDICHLAEATKEVTDHD